VYSAVDGKPKTTFELQRLTNIRAHPATALLVDHYDEDWSMLWWVRIDGTGRIVERGPERALALDALAAKYPQYRRSPPRGPAVILSIRSWRAWP
jgi:PPOX class probable F420-dependent enzyme